MHYEVKISNLEVWNVHQMLTVNSEGLTGLA